MTTPAPTIRINVDVTNPGQFFACCGLLELADRMWPGAVGWFDGETFCIASAGNLKDLITAASEAEMIALNPDDQTASPIRLRGQFRALCLNWWQDRYSGGRELKVWAGTMESLRITRAMQSALRESSFHSPDLLNVGQIVVDPEDSQKKVEPFYFDARRGPNAHSRDIGFSPNDLHITTTAHPAVEFLCLVGLQRCLPAKTGRSRVYEYFTWTSPVPTLLAGVAGIGVIKQPGSKGYQFENWYRTGQRKHKAFCPGTPTQ